MFGMPFKIYDCVQQTVACATLYGAQNVISRKGIWASIPIRPLLVFAFLAPACVLAQESNYWEATLAQCRSFLKSNLAVAAGACTRAVAEAEKFGPEDERLAYSLIAQADVHEAKYELRETLAALRRAKPIIEGKYGATDLRALAITDRLANLYLHSGQPREAIALLKPSLDKARAANFAASALAIRMNNLALAYREDKNYAEAEALFRESRSILYRQSGDPRHIAILTLNIADLASAQGKLAEAEASYREGFAMEESRQPHSSREKGYLLFGLGHVLRLQGNISAAEEVLRKAVIIVRNEMGMDHLDYAFTLRELAATLILPQQTAEGEQLRAQADKIVAQYREKNSRR